MRSLRDNAQRGKATPPAKHRYAPPRRDQQFDSYDTLLALVTAFGFLVSSFEFWGKSGMLSAVTPSAIRGG